jgi:orotate phosphoribosyltransferase
MGQTALGERLSKADEALRHKLVKLVRRLSYREGDFTLASGKKSKFYVDLKATTLHPEGAKLIGQVAARVIQAYCPLVEGVGGLTLGADPLATAISIAGLSEGCTWPAFIVRKEAKGHGTGKYIEGTENLRTGARLLVLEDVVTTGGSSIQAVHRLREAGFNPLAVLTVVDREQGGEAEIRKLGLDFLKLTTLKEVQSSTA